MATKKNYGKLMGQVVVDSGMIEIGDCGGQLEVPTEAGDGIYPVYLSGDGRIITIDTTAFVNGVAVDGDIHAWRKQVEELEAKRKERWWGG